MKLFWEHINYHKIDAEKLLKIDEILSHGKDKIQMNGILRKEYEVDSQNFNNKWNERHGNALGHLAAAYHRNRDSESLSSGLQLAISLIDEKNWNVLGHEDDDVNVLHLILGLILFISIDCKTIESQLFDKGLEKLDEILQKSVNNKKSEWYCSTTKIHNHCFHNLLLRYLCALTIVFHGGQKYNGKKFKQTIEILNKTRKNFHSNLHILKKIDDGITYEGPSYSAYTAFSLTIFGLLEKLYYGSNTTFDNEWVNNFPKAIRLTYISEKHISYNFADAPFNWSYGPEIQLALISKNTKKINEDIEFALQLINKRIILINKNKLTRNNVFFYSFLYFALQDAPIQIQKELQNSDAINLHHFKDNDILRIEKSPWLIFLRGGIHGGRICRDLKSKNIGHSYPSIGDVSIFYKSEALLLGGLYAKPKKTAMWSTFECQNRDDIWLGQEGDSLQKKGVIVETSPMYLDNLNYAYSPVSYEINSNIIACCVKIESYAYIGIKIKRLVILSKDIGLVIFDIIKKTPESEIKSIKINLNNSINKITPANHKDHFSIEGSSNINLILRTNDIDTIETHELNHKAHEFIYSISQLSITKKFTTDTIINSIQLSDENVQETWNITFHESQNNGIISLNNTKNECYQIHIKDIENEKLGLAISH
jgi:hypothetical protein